MKSLYTNSVSEVPANYNDPTTAYKKHVWIALAGMLSFFGFYLFLTIWFFKSAYRLLVDASGGDNSGFIPIAVGVACLFLGIFMIKAFFFVATKHEVQDREVKPTDEPVLFDFLHKLADETGAPRPNKVYLSNRVNASVFYELSFLNLFFPSKKNLEIGLGLINVLNLGEFKAVLAHEFGHFAQKSMLVGRWVYIANQIASALINKRDALDSFLAGLSRIDIRIAWIGWILSIIVWSIRSLVELIFRVVVLSQRALSREMEFQADLVSVSVTGSDALINALHKLQAADAAFSDSLGTLGEQAGKGKAFEDLYAIQTNAIEKTAYILNDESYGKSPEVPEVNPELHRVFSDKIAQPPKMWSTHPPDQEREANAKRQYISGHIDDRSAWDLFTNPREIRVQLTSDLNNSIQGEIEILSTEDGLLIHNKKFQKSYFNPIYRGVYLNRFFCLEFDDADSMYRSDLSVEESVEIVSKLYPTSLVDELEDFITLKEEMEQLEAIHDKRLTASGEGGIWHRGTQVRKKELPTIIRRIKTEVGVAQKRVTDHDQLVRTSHLRLAQKIGLGWNRYLKGLLAIIHYSEHSIANIRDAQRNLGEVLNVVLADNKVTQSELRQLIHESDQVYEALSNAYHNQTKIQIDELLEKELNLRPDETLFEELRLARANDGNINDWINIIDGWIQSYINSFNTLRSEALELLLITEERVVKMYQADATERAPSPSSINTAYALMPPGKTRETKMKMNLWDKFISAEGVFPAIIKFAVAASIVGGTVYLAGQTGSSDIYIYNGLGQTVMVDLNGYEFQLEPHSSQKASFTGASGYEITTRTPAGDIIEAFQPDLSSSSSNYVYNVAYAAAMLEYRVYYGKVPKDHERRFGAKRWLRSSADFIFEEAPDQLSSRSSGTTRDVLAGISDINPTGILGLVSDEQEQKALINAHVLWDSPVAPHLVSWLSLSAIAEDATLLLKERLERHPDEIITLRLLMDSKDEEVRKSICDEYEKKAESEPSNANVYYIVSRCLPDGLQKGSRYIEGAEKWPENSWLNFAASHYLAQRNEWQKSYDALQAAYSEAGSIQPAISLNAQRIRRYLEAQGKSVRNAKKLDSDILDHYEGLESSVGETPNSKVNFFIHEGALEQAISAAATIPDMHKNTIAVCAASDGGKQEWIDNALLFSSDSLNNIGILSVVALRLKNNKDISAFSESLANMSDNEEYSFNDFAEKIRSRNFSAAQEIIDKADIASKGQMCALAYMAYKTRIPADWKLKARTLLFASERGYMEVE